MKKIKFYVKKFKLINKKIFLIIVFLLLTLFFILIYFKLTTTTNIKKYGTITNKEVKKDFNIFKYESSFISYLKLKKQDKDNEKKNKLKKFISLKIKTKKIKEVFDEIKKIFDKNKIKLKSKHKFFSKNFEKTWFISYFWYLLSVKQKMNFHCCKTFKMKITEGIKNYIINLKNK